MDDQQIGFENDLRRTLQRDLRSLPVAPYAMYRAAALARIRAAATAISDEGHASSALSRLRAPLLATVAAALVVGGVATTAALAQAPEGVPERIAAIVRGVLAGPEGHVVATVNGRVITAQRLELEMRLRNAQGVSATRAQVLDALIVDSVVLSDAERRGVKVSDSEVASFIAEQRAMADADPDRQLYRYAAALGVSESAAWAYPPFVQAWREMLTYGAVKQSVLGPVTAETLAAKESEWSTYVTSLRAKALIRRFE